MICINFVFWSVDLKFVIKICSYISVYNVTIYTFMGILNEKIIKECDIY